MWLKGITDEDFVNYKVPSMFISTATCSFKCDKECGMQVCQNSGLAQMDDIHTGDDYLISRYLKNGITQAIVFGGLEPFDQWNELFNFIQKLRLQYGCADMVVIYTGYNENEIEGEIQFLMSMPNIIVKFGRYVPNQQPHLDPILGVNLASDNQYARQIS